MDGGASTPPQQRTPSGGCVSGGARGEAYRRARRKLLAERPGGDRGGGYEAARTVLLRQAHRARGQGREASERTTAPRTPEGGGDDSPAIALEGCAVSAAGGVPRRASGGSHPQAGALLRRKPHPGHRPRLSGGALLHQDAGPETGTTHPAHASSTTLKPTVLSFSEGKGRASQSGGGGPRPLSPNVKSPLQANVAMPSYLCEAALHLPVFSKGGKAGVAGMGAGVWSQLNPQDTTHCSTITQDQDIDSDSSCASHTSSLSDGSGGGSLDRSDTDGVQVSPRALRESGHSSTAAQSWDHVVDAHPAHHPEDMANTSSSVCIAPTGLRHVQHQITIGDVDVECRVIQRFGEPEGLGPPAGKITALQYCMSDLTLLAAGTQSGKVFVTRNGDTCDPPLVGHTAAVMDLEWSDNTQILITVSLDKTIRIWWLEHELRTSRCIRVIQEASVPLCLRITPSNNNIVLVGTVANLLKFYNVSTGKVVKRHKTSQATGYLVWSNSGRMVYLADAAARVTACEYEFLSHSLKRRSQVDLDRAVDCPVTSLCLRTSEGRSLLLANVMHSAVYIINATCPMTVLRRLPVPQRCTIIRSQFCNFPTLSFATGSEDGSLWLVQDNETQHQHLQVLKLQGHQGAVLNVAVNKSGYIASGDELGSVMIWGCTTKAANVTSPLRLGSDAGSLEGDRSSGLSPTSSEETSDVGSP